MDISCLRGEILSDAMSNGVRAAYGEAIALLTAAATSDSVLGADDRRC
jgi:hypothetical protein